jgi:hypothetical protein
MEELKTVFVLVGSYNKNTSLAVAEEIVGGGSQVIPKTY